MHTPWKIILGRLGCPLDVQVGGGTPNAQLHGELAKTHMQAAAKEQSTCEEDALSVPPAC